MPAACSRLVIISPRFEAWYRANRINIGNPVRRDAQTDVVRETTKVSLLYLFGQPSGLQADLRVVGGIGCQANRAIGPALRIDQ